MCIISLALSAATFTWGILTSAFTGMLSAVGIGGTTTTATSAALSAATMASSAAASPGLGIGVGGLALGGVTAAAEGAAASTVPWMTIGLVGLAVGGALAGGLVSTISGVQSAQMQSAQAEYMADVSKQNAQMAARQAESLDLQGNQERTSLRNKMLQTQGEARAGYAAGGVVLGAGSTADYEADIADAYDLDARNLNYDIASKKWKLQVEASNSMNQSSLHRTQASGFRSQASASLLSGSFGTVGNSLGAFGGALATSQKLGWLK